MNRIKIADLVSTHSDNYLQNLSEEEEARVIGGLPLVVIGIAIACALLLAHD
ncbi:MAG: hypothetical protein V7L05_11670 [Nostoc sp.]|uniref:hypothetical protein n=1 Tax=Nostoc sp. TaxID=1180 RepID=UPI002FFAF0D8